MRLLWVWTIISAALLASTQPQALESSAYITTAPSPSLHSSSSERSAPFLQVTDIDLASFTTAAHLDSTLFSAPFATGYSALWAKISLTSERFYGFYIGTEFSAVGKIADNAKRPITRTDMQEDPRIYSLLINNDEAKDLFYTSDSAHLPALFLGYEYKNMGFRVGRYAAEYEWMGDYLEGAEVYADIKGVRVAFGGFYRQSYANPAENTRYGYLKNLYEKHQGYAINHHFYADANYQKEHFGLRFYANYLASLYVASGLSVRYTKDFGFWDLGIKAHGTFVSAGIQDPNLCANPQVAEEVGLACYQKGSFGKRNGGVAHLEALLGLGYFHLSLGAVVNDKNHATNLLPIYADNNPLEYNTYIYGEGGRTGYVKLDYRGIMLGKSCELGGFIGLGRTMFFAPDVHYSNQVVGEIELDFTRVKWHLTIAYLDEVRYSRTLVSKLWIGYKF
ncbi:outer membrane family protein [uncultured Helicobacter sp.]|uniref:outer membrane family protein n=1 Tax=uncultured Helicobacter sp. TaxID=175537 RepID=UPI00263A1E3F|nr:outer membrane family protein [uncultured Helicobacter sp.]